MWAFRFLSFLKYFLILFLTNFGLWSFFISHGWFFELTLRNSDTTLWNLNLLVILGPKKKVGRRIHQTVIDAKTYIRTAIYLVVVLRQWWDRLSYLMWRIFKSTKLNLWCIDFKHSFPTFVVRNSITELLLGEIFKALGIGGHSWNYFKFFVIEVGRWVGVETDAPPATWHWSLF